MSFWEWNEKFRLLTGELTTLIKSAVSDWNKTDSPLSASEPTSELIESIQIVGIERAGRLLISWHDTVHTYIGMYEQVAGKFQVLYQHEELALIVCASVNSNCTLVGFTRCLKSSLSSSSTSAEAPPPDEKPSYEACLAEVQRPSRVFSLGVASSTLVRIQFIDTFETLPDKDRLLFRMIFILDGEYIQQTSLSLLRNKSTSEWRLSEQPKKERIFVRKHAWSKWESETQTLFFIAPKTQTSTSKTADSLCSLYTFKLGDLNDGTGSGEFDFVSAFPELELGLAAEFGDGYSTFFKSSDLIHGRRAASAASASVHVFRQCCKNANTIAVLLKSTEPDKHIVTIHGFTLARLKTDPKPLITLSTDLLSNWKIRLEYENEDDGDGLMIFLMAKCLLIHKRAKFAHFIDCFDEHAPRSGLFLTDASLFPKLPESDGRPDAEVVEFMKSQIAFASVDGQFQSFLPTPVFSPSAPTFCESSMLVLEKTLQTIDKKQIVTLVHFLLSNCEPPSLDNEMQHRLIKQLLKICTSNPAMHPHLSDIFTELIIAQQHVGLLNADYILESRLFPVGKLHPLQQHVDHGKLMTMNLTGGLADLSFRKAGSSKIIQLVLNSSFSFPVFSYENAAKALNDQLVSNNLGNTPPLGFPRLESLLRNGRTGMMYNAVDDSLFFNMAKNNGKQASTHQQTGTSSSVKKRWDFAKIFNPSTTPSSSMPSTSISTTMMTTTTTKEASKPSGSMLGGNTQHDEETSTRLKMTKIIEDFLLNVNDSATLTSGTGLTGTGSGTSALTKGLRQLSVSPFTNESPKKDYKNLAAKYIQLQMSSVDKLWDILVGLLNLPKFAAPVNCQCENCTNTTSTELKSKSIASTSSLSTNSLFKTIRASPPPSLLKITESSLLLNGMAGGGNSRNHITSRFDYVSTVMRSLPSKQERPSTLMTSMNKLPIAASSESEISQKDQFKIMQCLHESLTQQLGCMIPTAIQTRFITLGLHTLPRIVFMQYLDRGIFSVTDSFMKHALDTLRADGDAMMLMNLVDRLPSGKLLKLFKSGKVKGSGWIVEAMKVGEFMRNLMEQEDLDEEDLEKVETFQQQQEEEEQDGEIKFLPREMLEQHLHSKHYYPDKP